MSNKTTSLLLAADSGGTKTDWWLMTPDGRCVKKCTTAGVASLHAGMLPVADTLRTAKVMLGSPSVRQIYFSLGGPNTHEVQELLQAVWPDVPAEVGREASGALIASCREFLGCDGAILGGTGVTAMGFTADGCCYAEGWGPVYGDFGSGGGIGLRTVQTFLRGLDGTEDSGGLAKLFSGMYADLNVRDFSGRMELKRRINELTRRDLAALAPQVAQLAQEGDPAATKIIDASAENMAALAAAIAPPQGKILMLGGLFKLGADYLRRCERFLHARRPDCRWLYDERLSIVNLAAARVIQMDGHTVTSEIWCKIINE
jgi:N-acetylglucosamine kinase-like BadF-type ATPase